MPPTPPTAALGLEAFLQLLARYNAAVWPLQLVAYALGLAAVVLAHRGTRASSRLVAAVLAVLWAWVGVAFNWTYFRGVSRTGAAMAVLFVLEALLLVAAGVASDRMRFAARSGARGIAGAVMALYAMVGYPVVELALGRGYPRTLPFGMVPCPTAVFTLGLLLWARPRAPWFVVVIPIAYALAGVVPAAMGIVEDAGLVAAGIVSGAMIAVERRRAGIEAAA